MLSINLFKLLALSVFVFAQQSDSLGDDSDFSDLQETSDIEDPNFYKRSFAVLDKRDDKNGANADGKPETRRERRKRERRERRERREKRKREREEKNKEAAVKANAAPTTTVAPVS